MQNRISKYLDLELVSGIKFLDIRAKLIVESLYAGMHKSKYHGFSVEFSSHREYIAGDPLKLIDWKAYARTKKLYIRLFQEDTNLKSTILLDQSASMDYGKGALNKSFYSKTLAATFAYLLIKQKDNVGIAIFSKNINALIPPESGAAHLKKILIEIEKAKIEKGTGIIDSLTKILTTTKKRMLYIVISDFLDNPEQTRKKLLYIKKGKNEVIVFHLLHPEEINFNFEGMFKFYDPDSGVNLVSGSQIIRNSYKEAMNKYLSEFSHEMFKHGIDYYLVKTDTHFEEVLGTFLEKRKKL